MKAILEFNLPEEKDEFILASKGNNYYSALWDLNNEIRSKIEFEKEQISEKYKEFQKLFNQILENYNINLYEID